MVPSQYSASVFDLYGPTRTRYVVDPETSFVKISAVRNRAVSDSRAFSALILLANDPVCIQYSVTVTGFLSAGFAFCAVFCVVAFAVVCAVAFAVSAFADETEFVTA